MSTTKTNETSGSEASPVRITSVLELKDAVKAVAFVIIAIMIVQSGKTVANFASPVTSRGAEFLESAVATPTESATTEQKRSVQPQLSASPETCRDTISCWASEPRIHRAQAQQAQICVTTTLQSHDETTSQSYVVNRVSKSSCN